MQILQVIWKWVGNNDTQLKILFTVVAAFYVAVQYYLRVEEGKVQVTLQYIQKYDQGDVVKATTAVGTFWISDEAKQFFKRAKPDNYDNEFMKLADQNKMGPHIYVIRRFFQSLALCANNNVCDGQTVCDFFFDDLQAFRETYRPYLKAWSDNWGENVSRGIDHLVEKTCSPKFNAYCRAQPNSRSCRDK
ncbi:MAG: hypothetical protein HY459_04490 [Parcubacteria group bacterium]|nr:hypothetical protein [Parcubacteria group bacterium]